MTELIAALAALGLSHWLPSSPRLRPVLTGALGTRGFHIAYSMLSLAVVAWLIAAYGRAAGSGWLWLPPLWARWAIVLGMPVALWLVLARLMTRPGEEPAGIYRLTAAPGSVGILLWALLHLLNAGQSRAVALFAAFAVIALAAAVKNLRTAPRARRKAGLLPSLAILRGRMAFARRDVDWRPAALALALWAGLLTLHPMVIGPDPLAGLLN